MSYVRQLAISSLIFPFLTLIFDNFAFSYCLDRLISESCIADGLLSVREAAAC